MRIMKRYTLRALIHDAKIFNQLRLEYRQTKKNRRKDLVRLAVPLLGWHEATRANFRE
jgi:hypothetical protein